MQLAETPRRGSVAEGSPRRNSGQQKLQPLSFGPIVMSHLPALQPQSSAGEGICPASRYGSAMLERRLRIEWPVEGGTRHLFECKVVAIRKSRKRKHSSDYKYLLDFGAGAGASSRGDTYWTRLRHLQYCDLDAAALGGRSSPELNSRQSFDELHNCVAQGRTCWARGWPSGGGVDGGSSGGGDDDDGSAGGSSSGSNNGKRNRSGSSGRGSPKNKPKVHAMRTGQLDLVAAAKERRRIQDSRDSRTKASASNKSQ